MSTFIAVFEQGVLRPLEETNLKEGERVQVEVRPAGTSSPAAREKSDGGSNDPLAGIRFSGPPDLAENFDDYRFGRKTWP